MKTLTLSEADAKALARHLAGKWAAATMLLASAGTYNNPSLIRGERNATRYLKDKAAEAVLCGKALVQLGYALPEVRVDAFVRPLTPEQSRHEHYKGFTHYFIPKAGYDEARRMVKEMGL